MSHRLVVVRGPDAGKAIEISDEGTFLIGRGDGCDLQVLDPSLSRQHCRLEVSCDRIQISDAGSSWGTVVNSRRVDSAVVRPGDDITIGDTLLRVEVTDTLKDGMPEKSHPDTAGRPASDVRRRKPCEPATAKPAGTRRERQREPRPSSRPASRRLKSRDQPKAGLEPWVFITIGCVATLGAMLLAVFMFSADTSVDTGASTVTGLPEADTPATDPAVADVSATTPDLSIQRVSATENVEGDSVTSLPDIEASPAADDSDTGVAAETESAATQEEAESDRKPFESLADLIEIVEPSVVRINVESRMGAGNGSGFVVDDGGTVITNRHVIEGVSSATALFEGDDTEYPITGIYFTDAQRDIAILKVDAPPERLRPLPLADVLPRKGEDLVAFGAPLGLDFTATKGILSATRNKNDLAALGILGHEGTWLQHSVPISPGNSGGPLLNMKGEVVGANTLTLTIGQNLNFAISVLDLTDALQHKSTLEPFQENAVPVLARNEARPQTIDIVGTDQAKELLGQLRTVEVVMLSLGFDPTGRITETVRADMEEAVKKAKLRVTREGQAFMVVGMTLEEQAGSRRSPVGTQAVTITTIMFVRARKDNSDQVFKVWVEEEKVGTVAERLFLQGQMPTRLRSGIKSYFRTLSGAINRARIERERENS